MGSLKERLRHAFAVDEPGAAEPTEEQRPPVDWLANQVARRQLTTPGLIFLEMSRPLNWVGAQAMNYWAPAVWALASRQTYDGYCHFIKFLERRGSIEHIARRIEELDQQYMDAGRAGGTAAAGPADQSLQERMGVPPRGARHTDSDSAGPDERHAPRQEDQ